ncbi:MAG: S-adenosylmethionine:tRNA ribosyltransferase-isomerase [Sediminibacterium sp.]|nr:S-adenosylmethionine:tRNA ribosyltransferase-isomerase [Sediminibacterium sp.]
MHPRDLSIKDFTYSLPADRIARYPLPERDASKLLIWKNGSISTDIYANLAAHLPAGSMLVFNNTKVVEARLLFTKSNGSTIEIFCLEPHAQYPDITSAMLQKGKVWWKCLVGGAKKWKEGPLQLVINTGNSDIILTAEKMERTGDAYIIQLSWNDGDRSFAEILHLGGYIPLPPYLNRAPDEADKERYQTIYALYDGSVAAPTAGLHFTERLLQTLQQKNILHDFVTLHVGAGTFKPVKSETMQDHEMHAEFIDVTRPFIEQLLQRLNKPVIAVGTTSMRTLESLYWLGVKIILHPGIDMMSLTVSQWEPYEIPAIETTAQVALNALLEWIDRNGTGSVIAKTQIIIAPGYRFRIVQALITNFHQPQSTLLLLVAAITGDEWRTVYDHALSNEFRFLSYGDGNLLWLRT